MTRLWQSLAMPALVVAVAAPEKHTPRTDPLLVEDPIVLMGLEDEGLSFERVVGRDRFAAIADVVRRDMSELAGDLPVGSPRRAFQPSWLARGRFELVAVVNRLDRRVFDPSGCGEVRLVYRLAIRNKRRPVTRLPMTVNVRIPQRRARGEVDCRKVAERWLAGNDLADRVDALLPPAQIEINFQSIHAPGLQHDMDDNAQYVLRSFAVDGRTVRPDGLFNTPRADVPRSDLLRWIGDNLQAIDEARAVLPRTLLAERIVSVSPRGLVHEENRPFSRVLAPSDLANLDLRALSLARTPELLARRLDEATCAGCHQTRGVAGFHLLGEERRDARLDRLAIGHSPHLGADLAWRRADLESVARGGISPVRPFAAYPNGLAGADCGIAPGLSTWTCAPGLVCRDIHHADVGVCARPNGAAPGDPCEDVTFAPNARPEGALVTARAADEACPAPVGEQLRGKFCAPNWLGFTGGVCSERCDTLGATREDAICGAVPSAGYEGDCFAGREPVEACLPRHLVQVWVAACDAARPCRDDYGCARVPGAPAGVGACVPPYFLFQTRVDGPPLDR